MRIKKQKIKKTCLTLLAMTLMVTVKASFGAYRPAQEAKQGMVVSEQALASQVGADILKMGGNAIDAAVAVGYALAVVHPCCGNIGGGGFMTIHLANGQETFIDFREMAPAASHPDMFLDKQGNPVQEASLYGYQAVGVPGTVMGLETALKKYGTLTRKQIMAPAIKLARQGFTLEQGDVDILNTTTQRFRADPQLAHLFLRPDGSELQAGDKLVQKDLAITLESISRKGPDAFYKGAIPLAVERAAKAHGGIITAADFAAYHIRESAPVSCTYRGYRFISAPPPSSGGTALCEILNILEGYDMKALGFHSAASVHVMVEAMRHAYMDRNTFLGDPAFIKNPLNHLLSKSYAAEIRKKITEDKATPSTMVQPGMEPHEKDETTHYSIVDKAGNAVSTTYTINGRFGAVVMAPGTGFFLNDEMDDFTVKPGAQNLFGLVQGVRNAIAPGKRPLSSMSPTIISKDGKTFMVLGSPGGSRIITITLETALNVIDYGMEPQEAVNAPRLHHQWMPDEVYYEKNGLSPDTLKALTAMGYTLKEQTPWGAAELVLVGVNQAKEMHTNSSGNDSALSGHLRPGFYYGANDDRRPAGKAVGY